MRGKTQAVLAAEVGVKQPVLSRIERGLTPPPSGFLQRVGHVLAFPDTFFHHAHGVDFGGASLRFRARAGAATRDLTQARRVGEVVYEHHERMRRQVRQLSVTLRPTPGLAVAAAAAHARAVLGLPAAGPLPHLVLALERAGVAVLAAPLTADKHDAFSLWLDDRPAIVLLRGLGADRLRFSVGHELGHLLLHRGHLDGRQAEAEADAFAAELLVPARDFAAALPRKVTLGVLVAMKEQWGVSLRVLIRQARAVGAIPQEQYASLFRQLSARGWTRDEPGVVAVEKPRAFMKMAELLYGEAVDLERFASDAGWTPAFALEVLAGHATARDLPVAVQSGAVVSNVVPLMQRVGR
jgi:Zn-dependent peptidase ImmA (M78 family)/transcriptional regulator with XRE-family HTH domain